MGFKYLTKDVLDGFDKYRYNSIDTSPLSNYVMHPFWNRLVLIFPKWIAPNALTLTGFLMLVAQFGLFSYYDHYFYASDNSHQDYHPVPTNAWLAAALFMFWAHQLDGIDGKQARRTNTSSPLGELFDHGLDSWSALIMPVGIYSVFGRGENSIPPDQVFYVLISILLMFFWSHWEKYNTGVLYLPWAYDFSQLGMTSVYLATYFYGYEMWKVTVYSFTIGELFAIFIHLWMLLLLTVGVWGVSVPVSIYNVYVSYNNKTGKNLSAWESFRPLIPCFVEFSLFILWANNSSYNIVSRHPRLFFVAVGTLFSNIACRCVVNGMSNTRCQAFNWMLIPLLAIVVGVLTMHLGVIELYLLFAYAIFVVAAHIHYGICVVNELADHLNIYVFSVERPSHPKKVSE